MSNNKVSVGEKTAAEINADYEMRNEPVALVCASKDSPSVFDDDLFGECSDCGDGVRFRPTSPNPPGRILLCLRCGVIRMQQERDAGNGLNVTVSKETVNEVQATTGKDLRALFRKFT